MGRAFYYDMAERAGWTFVQAFVGIILATQDLSLVALEGALVASALAVAKAFAAGQFGQRGNAALPDQTQVKTFGARR